jgi:predicted transcriptional regulator
MPGEPRAGRRALDIVIPEELARRLDDLLAQTRRTVTAELILALEHWLERQGVGEVAVEPPQPVRGRTRKQT